MSGRLGIDDLEDLTQARLGPLGCEELLDAATETVLAFNGPDGWPRAVVVSFTRHRGSWWIAGVRGRGYVRAIGDDPRVSLVVTNAGTALEGRRMLALRGQAVIHDDPVTRREMLPLIATRLAPSDPAAMVRLLDSPGRVVLEVKVVGTSVSHDSRRIAGNGRGGPALGAGGDRPRQEER